MEEEYYNLVKDKANQLVINFLEFTPVEFEYEYAKKCALLTVKEILSQWGNDEDLKDRLTINIKYWQDVRDEINKL